MAKKKNYFDLALSAAGKTRKYPVSKAFKKNLDDALAETAPGLTAEITSGGQMSIAEAKKLGATKKKGTSSWYLNGKKVRTGSTRHDVDASGESQTADVVLKKDGKLIKPGEDKKLYAAFIQNAAKRFPGIGHYEWGIHVGGGSEAFWGPTTGSKSADPTFKNAFAAGRKGASASIEGGTELGIDTITSSALRGTQEPKQEVAGPIAAIATLIGQKPESLQRDVNKMTALPLLQEIGDLVGLRKPEPEQQDAATSGTMESLLRPSLNAQGESEVDTSAAAAESIEPLFNDHTDNAPGGGGLGEGLSDGMALMAGIGQLFAAIGGGGGQEEGGGLSHRGLDRAKKRGARGLTPVGAIMSGVRVR